MLGISPRKIQYRLKEYAEEDRDSEGRAPSAPAGERGPVR
jgi:hypothetical protein